MEAGKIGANEFEGLAIPYGTVADCGARYDPGSIRCNGQTIITQWEHHCGIGVAKLIETSAGILAHGRIANNTATSQLVLGLLHAGLKFGLCLSVSGEGQPRELSICLRGGFPGTEISKIGPLNFQPTAWDWNFYPTGLSYLLKVAAESTCAQGLIKAGEYQKYTAVHPQNGSLETWLRSMEAEL